MPTGLRLCFVFFSPLFCKFYIYDARPNTNQHQTHSNQHVIQLKRKKGEDSQTKCYKPIERQRRDKKSFFQSAHHPLRKNKFGTAAALPCGHFQSGVNPFLQFRNMGYNADQPSTALDVH